MKVLINNGNGFVDYTQYVVQGTLNVEDSINVPTTIEFQLCNINNAFTSPIQGAYIRIVSEKYSDKVLATGFVTNEPEREYLGLALQSGYATQFQLYTYDVKATSDEWLLNVKSVPYIPAFVNLGTGQILAKLAEALAPGFFDTTSQVASGDLVPYFAYSSDRNWSDIAKELADGSRYHYKVRDRVIYFQPFGDAPLGVSYDEVRQKEAEFYPAALKSGVLTVPPVNDATVLGSVEPQTICEDTFIGDGFTGNFPLRHNVFDGESNILLQDDWSEGKFNDTYWDVEDPVNAFSLIGQLNVVGGDGNLGDTYILGKSGIELGGGVNLQHGQIIFNDTSEGIIGGIYSQVEELDFTKCISGFSITPSTSVVSTVSGASGIIIQPIYNGQLVGPQIVTQINHQYFLQTVINAHRWDRFNQIYRTLDSLNEFGGNFPDSKAEILYIITDLDLGKVMLFDSGTRIVTSPGVDTTFVQEVDTGFPPFGVYLPVNCQFMNITMTATLVAFPPQGSLRVSNLIGPTGGMLPILPSQVQEPPQNYLLGFGFANDTATISLQGDVDNLSFYADDLPAVGARIHLKSWAAGTAIGRIRDSNNVAESAVITGDDGVRAAIITGLKPPPRTSEECEFAAAAAILDRENPQFQGSYSFYDYFWDALGSDYPQPGRYFFCNSPNRAVKEQNLIVHTTRATIVELRDEIIQFEIDFGSDLYLEKLLAKFLERTESTLTPQQTSTVLTPIELSQVGFFYAPSLHDAHVGDDVTDLDSFSVTIDLGVTPATGCEVRRSDNGWGKTSVNLQGTFTSQFITLPRNQIDQTWYLRQVNGTQISRHSAKIRVVAPLIPSPPLLIGQSTTALALDFNGDIRNIYGVEIRVTAPPPSGGALNVLTAQRVGYYVTLTFPPQAAPPFSPGDVIQTFFSADPYAFLEGVYFIVDAVTNSSVSYWQARTDVLQTTPVWTVPTGVAATVQLFNAGAGVTNIVTFSETNGVVTVVTDRPHGLHIGDIFEISMTPSSVLFNTGFDLVQQTVTVVVDPFTFQFNDVFFIQSNNYTLTNVTGAQIAEFSSALTQSVIFQRVAATPGDLNFDLTLPQIAHAIELAETTLNPQMFCYFFNLLWGYSAPLILPLPISVVPRGVVLGASGTGCNCLDPRDFGAVGDGITDDTIAVQKALNQARANYLAKKPSNSSIVCIHTCEKVLVTPQVLDNCNGVGFGKTAVALFIDPGVTLEIEGEVLLGNTTNAALTGYPFTMVENRNAFVIGAVSDTDIRIRGKGKLNGSSITPAGGVSSTQASRLIKHTNNTGGLLPDTDPANQTMRGSVVIDGDTNIAYVGGVPKSGGSEGVYSFNAVNGAFLGYIGDFTLGNGTGTAGTGYGGGGYAIMNHPTLGKWLIGCSGSINGEAVQAMAINAIDFCGLSVTPGFVTNIITTTYGGIFSGGNSCSFTVDNLGNIWAWNTAAPQAVTFPLHGVPVMQQVYFNVAAGLTCTVALQSGTQTRFDTQPGSWTVTTQIAFDPLSKTLIIMGQNAGGNLAQRINISGFGVVVQSTSLPTYQMSNISNQGEWIGVKSDLVTMAKIRASDFAVLETHTIFDFGFTDTISYGVFDGVNNLFYAKRPSSVPTVWVMDWKALTSAKLLDPGNGQSDPSEVSFANFGADIAISPNGDLLCTVFDTTASPPTPVGFVDFWGVNKVKMGVIGIRFYNTDRTRVEDITIEQTTLCGVEWGLSDKAEILDTYCVGPNLNGWGYLLDTLNSFWLGNNLVDASSGTGIIGIGEYGCSDGLIEGNIVENTDNQFFLHSNIGFESGEPQNCSGLAIEGNEFSKGTGSVPAVQISGQADSLLFRGNTIANNSQLGMSISGLNGATISGNAIRNNGNGGLSTDRTAPLLDVSIVDNVIEGNSIFDLALPPGQGNSSPLYDDGTNTVFAFNPAIDPNKYYSTGRQAVVQGTNFGSVGQRFPLSGPSSLIYAIKGGANPVQQIGTAIQISIGAFTLEFPDKEISYAGIATLNPTVGSAQGLYYVFVDDPWHDGVTGIQYGMTMNPDDLCTSQCRLFLGNIWLLSTGGGVGTGGGNGPGNGPILTPPPYLATSTWTGTIPSSQVFMLHPPAKDTPFFFADSLANSAGVLGTPPASGMTFSIQKNGVQFGTMVFAAGATLATFSGTNTTFKYPDVLKVVAPASVDPNAADLGFTLKALRVIATAVQLSLTLADDNSGNWNDIISSSNFWTPSLSDNLNNWADGIVLMLNNQFRLGLSDNMNFWQDIAVQPEFLILSDMMTMLDSALVFAVINRVFSETLAQSDNMHLVLGFPKTLSDSMSITDGTPTVTTGATIQINIH